MSIEYKQRSSWEVTWSVWRAMFIREALQRTMADRLSWFWLLAQPIAQILMFVGVREVIGRMDIIAGAAYIPWLIVGMMVFMLFSEGVVRSLGAIEASRGLMSYRQVRPIDAVVVRVFVEGVLKATVLLVLVVAFEFMGFSLLPKDPLAAIAVWLLAWLFGVAMGVLFAVITCVFKGLAVVVRLSMMPLYFLSGVMIPVNFMPRSIQEILSLNPVLHLVEIMRLAWFDGYLATNGVNSVYVLVWCMFSLFLGLVCYMRLEERLIAS